MRITRIVLLLVALAASAYAIARVWQRFAWMPAVDFYLVYVNTIVAGRDDIPNIYAPEAQSSIGEEFFARSLDSGSEVFHSTARARRTLDSRGSPFLYAAFGWVSRDFERALTQQRIFITAAYFAAILLLGRYCRRPLWLTIFLFALLTHFYFPFRADFIVGNVNAIQLFLLALALTVSERRPVLAGAILGLMLAMKPNVVLVLAIFVLARIITRDFRRLGREIAGGAIGGVLAFVIGSLWFETPRIWLLWIGSAGDLYETLLSIEFNNVTPALPLFQRYGTWISYVIALVLIAIVCVALRKGKRADDLLLVSFGILIYNMSATLVWLHYMLLCILPAFALFRSRWTAIVSAIALVLMADVPYEIFFGPSTPQLRAQLVLIAMTMLFAACVWILWRGRGRIPAASEADLGAVPAESAHN